MSRRSASSTARAAVRAADRAVAARRARSWPLVAATRRRTRRTSARPSCARCRSMSCGNARARRASTEPTTCAQKNSSARSVTSIAKTPRRASRSRRASADRPAGFATLERAVAVGAHPRTGRSSIRAGPTRRGAAVSDAMPITACSGTPGPAVLAPMGARAGVSGARSPRLTGAASMSLRSTAYCSCSTGALRVGRDANDPSWSSWLVEGGSPEVRVS